MLSAIDEAFDHIDNLNKGEETNMLETNPETGNIDELLAALPGILDEVEKLNILHQSGSGSTTFTAVGASAGALLAIGAGFIIKNKFAVAQKEDLT
jgi:hypothetical protein